MSYILTGLIFVFLDFNIDLGAARIGLIPDFIGYILVLKGLAELAAKSETFARVRPFAFGMAVYTAFLYILDLLGLAAVYEGYASFFLGMVSLAVSLYITYRIVRGIKELESIQNRTFQADTLYSAWRLMAVFSFAAVLGFIIPVLNLVCLIASLVFNVYFLVLFNRTKNAYYNTSQR